MKGTVLISILLIYAVSYLPLSGISEDRKMHASPISNQTIILSPFLEGKSVNVSTFTVNASFYTPSLTVVNVDAYSTTVAIVEQEGVDLSVYVPVVLIIILTIAVIILILKKKRISSRP
ncbi:hypothetical protein [[Eubacterium] cellulosolvens]